MVRERKNGIQTKQNIMNVAKQMFFEKGYLDTLYDDICREANVNAGAMYYHFKSKGVIAGKIYSDFIALSRERMLEILPEGYDNTVSAALEIRCYLHLMLSNRKLLRFLHDIYIERIPNLLGRKTIGMFYERLANEFNIELSHIDIETIAAGAAGFQGEIIMSFYEGLIHDSDSNLIEYYLSMRFKIMELPQERISAILLESKKIFESIDCSLEDYFIPVYKLKK